MHEKVVLARLKNIFGLVQRRRKKNTKKIGRLLRTNISRTPDAISFKFGMQGGVYVEHKIYKFGKNRRDSFRDTDG